MKTFGVCVLIIVWIGVCIAAPWAGAMLFCMWLARQDDERRYTLGDKYRGPFG
jgi:hypothetical protein